MLYLGLPRKNHCFSKKPGCMVALLLAFHYAVSHHGADKEFSPGALSSSAYEYLGLSWHLSMTNQEQIWWHMVRAFTQASSNLSRMSMRWSYRNECYTLGRVDICSSCDGSTSTNPWSWKPENGRGREMSNRLVTVLLEHILEGTHCLTHDSYQIHLQQNS